MTEKKYEMLIRLSKEIVEDYWVNYGITLTVRQIYYQLVESYKVIENNRSQYVYFDKVITKYRQKNLEFANKFKDEKRIIIDKSRIDYPLYNFSEVIEDQITYVQKGYPQFTFNKNLFQDKINVILLEKFALKDIFEKVITSNTILVVSSGINSFSQMNDLRNLISEETRELKLYVFTDLDDTGYFIQENFIDQMRDFLRVEFDSINRVALTPKLIDKYKLPVNPDAMKKKRETSTHKKYDIPYFVELDALKPDILMYLVKKTCEQNFDNDLYQSIAKTMKIRNRRLKTKYFKELKKIDLTKI